MTSYLPSCFIILIFLSCNAPPKPNFKIAEPVGTYSVVLDDLEMRVMARGRVINLTASMLDDYELIVTYTSFNEKGESYQLKSDAQLYAKSMLDDGFGGGFMKEKPAWSTNSIKEFKLSDHISRDDAMYPTSRMVAVVSINASDPFGHKYQEQIAIVDITEQWLHAQSNLKMKLNK